MTDNLSKKTMREGSVILSPNPRLPLIITALGLMVLPLPFHPLPSLLISGFGLALLIQTLTLRLEFNSEAMVVWQLGRVLRSFPFKEWLAWRLFLPELPGILYFREEASPHLLPILFDRKSLENQLRKRVGSLERPSKPQSSPNK